MIENEFKKGEKGGRRKRKKKKEKKRRKRREKKKVIRIKMKKGEPRASAEINKERVSLSSFLVRLMCTCVMVSTKPSMNSSWRKEGIRKGNRNKGKVKPPQRKREKELTLNKPLSEREGRIDWVRN